MSLTYFSDAIDGLQASFPQWWNTETGETAIVLDVLAELLDELAAQIEGIYSDMALASARQDALQSEWAYLFGASNEQLPPTTEALRAYLQARAGEDGSEASLERALLALLDTDANNIGSELIFPADGSGLIFPADGSGLVLFEHTSGDALLRFPVDGSGLIFPADGSGLIFPADWRIEVIEHFSDFYTEVLVKDFLAFDRGAFARAVERHRKAHQLPAVITETPT